MKKISIAVILIFAFIAYSLYERKSYNMPVTIPSNTNTDSGNNSNNVTASPNSPPPSSPEQTRQTAQFKDGSFSGDSTDAYYGTIQVQVTIHNGEISDVKFLQYPNDRGQSIEINNYAMPLLKQEAIQTQHAHVDIISGATQTSQAFQQSLQSALDKAKA